MFVYSMNQQATYIDNYIQQHSVIDEAAWQLDTDEAYLTDHDKYVISAYVRLLLVTLQTTIRETKQYSHLAGAIQQELNDLMQALQALQRLHMSD